jgi:predicted GNAT family acetyltransferase
MVIMCTGAIGWPGSSRLSNGSLGVLASIGAVVRCIDLGLSYRPGGESERMKFRNNEEHSRYELLDHDRVVGMADYFIRGESVVLPHTEVAQELRGRGLGAILVRGALEDVRRSGRTVVPACWFVAAFIDAHPEYRDMLVA